MRCGYCGYEFKEEEGIQGCKNCPMTSGCKMVKCPRCNYENAPEPLLVTKIKKFLKKKEGTTETQRHREKEVSRKDAKKT